MKRILLIQPPFVQLNGPYPSLYYLRGFLAAYGHELSIRDHSIGLFGRIFCRAGLERIFGDAEALLAGPGGGPDKQTRETAARFLSESGRWISCIDRLINFLRGRDRE
ncbi:MAG: radical SAM protein, partial [Treponema sp.]|nr:radical SAM protein [Treponema sp.]